MNEISKQNSNYMSLSGNHVNNESTLLPDNKALIFSGKEQINYERIPYPMMEDNKGAIVRTIVSGLCGSDLHPYHCKEECAVGSSFGHEAVVTIVKVGSNVKDETMICGSQKFVVPFSTACGDCYFCTELKVSARCVNSRLFGWKDPTTNEGLNGCQSLYFYVPNCENTLFPLSPELSVEEGLLIGDIATTALYAAVQVKYKVTDDCINI